MTTTPFCKISNFSPETSSYMLFISFSSYMSEVFIFIKALQWLLLRKLANCLLLFLQEIIQFFIIISRYNDTLWSGIRKFNCNPLSYFLLDKQIKKPDLKIFSNVYHCDKLLLKRVKAYTMQGPNPASIVNCEFSYDFSVESMALPAVPYVF